MAEKCPATVLQRGRNAPQHPNPAELSNYPLPVRESRSGGDIPMHYSKDKNIASLVRNLVRTGWRYQMGGRHGKVISPAGHRIPVPCTPN